MQLAARPIPHRVNHHWPQIGGCTSGERVLVASSRTSTTGGRRLAARCHPLGTQCAHHKDHVHVYDGTGMSCCPAPRNAVCDRSVGLAGRGNSAIKRVAIVAGSGCDAGASGSSAINDANRCVAVAPNNPANLAASCQRSISSRASADRTLSNIPFLSSPSGGPRQLVLERGGDKDSRIECAE